MKLSPWITAQVNSVITLILQMYIRLYLITIDELIWRKGCQGALVRIMHSADLCLYVTYRPAE